MLNRRLLVPALCFLCLDQSLHAQTTTFTYQGRLADGGVPANGPYDFTFRLYDLASGGTQIGGDVLRDDDELTAGLFTVTLDFGASPFTSDTARFLEISVRPGASTGAYAALTPLQPLTLTSAEAAGVYVADKSIRGFAVHELGGGKSNASFDWIAIARRKGFDDPPAP